MVTRKRKQNALTVWAGDISGPLMVENTLALIVKALDA